MKTSNNILWSLSLVVLSGLIGGCADSERVSLLPDSVIVDKKMKASIHPTENYYLGQVEVRLVNEDQLSGVLADQRVKEGVQLSLLDKIPNRPIFLLEVNSTGSVDEAIASLEKDSRVVVAARNKSIKLDKMRTNDPLVPMQWALSNFSQEPPGALSGKSGADIGMSGVTAEGSHDVVVAVIDTGIDYYHEDLAITETVGGKKVLLPGSNIWTNPEEIEADGINNDNNGDPRFGIQYVDDVHGYNFASKTGDAMDDAGHGTHVSGVIGALRNNFLGISGINQKVSLMALKFLSADGGGSTFDAQLAVYYAIDMKKRFPNKKFILQCSWGSQGRDTKDGDDKDTLLMAFAEAARADILTVVAAGNDGTSNRFDPHYPANYSGKIPNLISVAATNNFDQLASFSSYGYDQVQIAAPGVLIQSTVPKKLFPAGYAAWSGTSMATPHVAGAAALVWSQNMNMTADQVKARLINSADALPQLHGVVSSSGRLNIRKAVAGEVNQKPAPVPDPVPYVQESPRAPADASYDLMTEIKQPGAKEISVCFSRINVGGQSDLIEILDKNYRVKDTITGDLIDHNYKNEFQEICTAPVLGESIYIRLARSAGSEGLQGFQTKFLKVVKNETK